MQSRTPACSLQALTDMPARTASISILYQHPPLNAIRPSSAPAFCNHHWLTLIKRQSDSPLPIIHSTFTPSTACRPS